MKQVVYYDDFYKAFADCDRLENFSFMGLRALFDYLEDLEEQTGEEITLDVITLCCEFTEYDDLEELQQNYNDIETMDDLNDHTIVIPIPGRESFIIQNY
jgi:hypothetical protein